MAEYKNPDFTQIGLSDAPDSDAAAWKAKFEQAAKEDMISSFIRQWSMCPLSRSTRTTNTRT